MFMDMDGDSAMGLWKLVTLLLLKIKENLKRMNCIHVKNAHAHVVDVPFVNPTSSSLLLFDPLGAWPSISAPSLAGLMARIKPQALLQQSKRKKGPSRISVTTIIFYALIVVLIAFFLYATYRHWSNRSRLQSENHLSVVSEGENAFVDSKKSELPGYAVLNTSKGSIIIELYKESAPEVVDEFIDLCQKGHFKGMFFHRVIKHYVIQAGDNQGTAATEDWNLRGKQHASVKHEAFMLGTSKGKHINKGFDLFITTAPIPDLNEKLIVFGQVIKGEDVVQEIEEVDTDEHYKPKISIGILDVTLKQKI
ncbi:hypothetical protein VNO77_12978 [Canavalia gladiata]|uniref:peptidylprolyl isomerase n=1 Tax=Canavalia gladiata TaxID=3824 RepID=A0AAN9QN40_CANGL